MNKIKLMVVFFLIAVNSINCMTEEQLAECRRMQTIDPQASAEEYGQLIERSFKKGLGVCGCWNALFDHHMDKVIKPAFEQEYNIDSSIWERLDKFKQLRVERDGREGMVTIHTNIPGLSIQDQQFIQQHFEKGGYKNGRINIIYDEDILSAAIRETSNGWDLFLGYGFRFYTREGRKGALLHEMMHFKNRDLFIKRYMLAEVMIKKKLVIDYLEFDQTSCKEYNIMAEQKADQLPAACGSLEDAQCMEQCMVDSSKPFPVQKFLTE